MDYFIARIPRQPSTLEYVSGIDNVIVAAAQTLAQCRYTKTFDYTKIPQGRKRRMLADKILESSPLLQSHRAAGRLSIEGLAEACDGILTPDIVRLSTRPELGIANVTNAEIRVIEDADADADFMIFGHNRLQQGDNPENNDPERPGVATTQIDTLPEQRCTKISGQRTSTVICSLRLFSKLQAKDRFASVVYAFSTTNSLSDSRNVLVDYGVVSSEGEISNMVLLFKGFAVGVEHNQSLRAHLAVAHADRAPLLIIIEDRLNGSQASSEEMVAQFINASS
jgi:hypothetical protein